MMFDIAILGGGPAGYTAAEHAQKNGLSVVLFEKKALGGTCLNEGCIPTKALLYSAKQYHNAVEGAKYGVCCGEVGFDYAKMQQRKTKVVRKLVAGIKQKLKEVTVISGEAAVSAYDPSTGHVSLVCNGETYESNYLLLCTGSTNVLPPIPGIDLPHVWNSTDALASAELPQRIAIVGGGVIGMEFACLYNTLGVDVTVIEGTPHILGNMDYELTDMLQAMLQKQGIKFLLGAMVSEIREDAVVCKGQEGECVVEADKVLVAVGRKANVDGLEVLMQAGLEVNRGVVTDARLRTNLSHIYAAGDVNGKSMLAHTAVSEAELAVADICGEKTDGMAYDAIPGVVYVNPEVASVGYSEQQAEKASVPYAVKKLPMAFSGRFVAENEGVNGLCKVLYGPEDGRLLGAHILGNGASEIINYVQLAISRKETVASLRSAVVAHPSVTEIVKETLFSSASLHV